MAKQIFINLAVSNLQRSMAFYEALGFTNNPQFSDESGKCMVWTEHIYVMLLTHEKFKSFIEKPLADTKTGVAGLYSLSVESPEEMNAMMTRGLRAALSLRRKRIMVLCSSAA